jgi:hypothetical protein
MYILPNDRQIYISSRVWHEVSEFVDELPFQFTLHDKIDLLRYGNGLKKFYFNFLITPHDVLMPYTYFSKKRQEADISVSILYQTFLKATPTQRFKLLESAYLEGIDQLAKRLKNQDFDTARFKADVAALFAKEDWYMNTEQMVSA